MAGPQRPASGLATRRTAMRQTTRRTTASAAEKSNPPTSSAKTPAPSTSRLQPAEQTPSSRNQERTYEREVSADTSIHVVVRCRGRNEHEIKENSGVAVATEGVKGKTVELSMGPNAVSNKTYSFDQVFSPAANQEILYEDVVLPILNEMLAGFNCTIFAYGQTGTGKTYTMSGDMTDTLGILSDNAGIIPRVLYSLFHKLEETDSAVKCSFIELYNEELRDLLAVDDKTKLKIFDSEPKKGQTGSTLVQGVEETYIDSASAGIKLLQQGSYKRQVAATKCNDLSSRSHTVFTIAVCTKRTAESGEEYISSGKLNLVDLAGSENIQRSGAENKRAAEAGLINKSLLTLGRVINALVDKSSHIPYRESKLTRLLQDSLGGRTKTCIVATVTNSRSNIEETISTLDYAFRAKNIRNMPQINPNMLKGTLIRQYTFEIQKLKSELIATRHRNGVYMPLEAHEEMTMEIESRRIVNEEQRAKIESMESSLRHKVQELFTLTSNFNNLKKDHEETKVALSNTNDILQKTDIVLKQTKANLEAEEMLRQAHQTTEGKLHGIGAKLLSSLNQAVGDVDGLYAKLERKAALDILNQEAWQTSTTEVSDVTSQVDARVEAFQSLHSNLLGDMSHKINQFVKAELANVQSSRSQLDDFTIRFDKVESAARSQTSDAHSEMNEVLEEIKVLREDVKTKVGDGLDGLSAAAARISKEVIGELSEFHAQLRESYNALGENFKSMFEDMVSHLDGQKNEISRLRAQVQEANREAVEANRNASSSMGQLLEEEHARAEAEREQLLSQIKVLMEDSRQKRFSRLKGGFDNLRTDISSSSDSLEQATVRHDRQIDEWVFKAEQFAKDINSSKDDMRMKMQNDWEVFDQRNVSIQKTTESVHEETVRIVDTQMKDMGRQLEALDDFVAKARSQNGHYHEGQLNNLESMAKNVRRSYSTLHGQVDGLGDRVGQLQQDAARQKDALHESTAPLAREVRQPLLELRDNVQSRPLKEYTATGVTPKKRSYEYPSTLPRTQEHGELISRLRNSKELTVLPFNGENRLSPNDTSPSASPSKQFVYNDAEDEVGTEPPATTATASNTGLREVDANAAARPPACDADASGRSSPKRARLSTEAEDGDQLALKRHCSTSAGAERNLPKMAVKKLGKKMEGRENIPPSTGEIGRRLRGRPSG